MKEDEKTREQLLDEVASLRKQVENYREMSKIQMLETVMDILPVGVIFANSEGKFFRTNQLMNQIWGGNIPILSRIDDYNEYKASWAESGMPIGAWDWALARALTAGETSTGEIINIQRFDGTEGTVISSAAPFRNSSGKIEGAVVLMQDATEQKLIDKLLKVAVNDLSVEEFCELTLDTILSMPFIQKQGTIYLLEEPDTLVLKTYKGVYENLLLKKAPVKECICSKIDENNQLVFVSGNECLYLQKIGVSNHLCIPVIKGSSLLGVISISLKENFFQSTMAKEYLTSISNTLANFIVRKRAEQELIKHRDNLQKLVKEQTAELEDEIKERRRLEERFAIAFNGSPSAMTISSLDYVFIDVNRSFERITEYCKDEVLGKTSYQLGLMVDESEVAELNRKLINKGFYNNWETQIRTKSNDIRTILASLEIITVNGEKHILTVFDDITKQKQFEKEMARLDRLSLIGQMAGGIGHEVRNPMTSVKGFLQLLASKETDVKKSEYYDIMIDEIDRANSIITEFLSLAKDRLVNLEPASLNDIIDTLYPLIATDAIKQDIRVTLIKDDIPQIPLSEKEIRQLVINLVRNGLESMTSGGSINIGTRLEESEVVLYVKDEGTGIKPEILDKLGHPFVTTKDNGTGLGLAVCYSIANKHNARIEVKTGSSGTTFFIRFKLPNSTKGGNEQKEIDQKCRISNKNVIGGSGDEPTYPGQNNDENQRTSCSFPGNH